MVSKIYERITISRLFVLLCRRSKTTIYIDLFSPGNSLIIKLLAYIFGTSTLRKIIENSALSLKLHIKDLPRNGKTADYDRINMMARIEATRLLSIYLSSEFSVDETPVAQLISDENSRKSAHLKGFCYNLSLLVERLMVVRTINSKLVYQVNQDIYPKAILNMIAERFAVRIELEKGSWGHLKLPGIALLVLLRLCKKLFLPNPTNQLQNIDFLVEGFDGATGGVSCPEFIFDKIDGNGLVYFRSDAHQASPIKTTLPHVRCAQLGVPPKVLVKSWPAYKVLARNALKGIPSRILLEQLGNIYLFEELTSLLQAYKPKLHLFNVFPNGQVGVRYDAGVVTGACRQMNVKSISYQTRFPYLDDFHYYFDPYDTYFFWGNAYKKDLRNPEFIRKSKTIGDVYVSDLPPAKCSPNSIKSLVLLPSDFEDEGPYHHSTNYVARFVSDCLAGVSKFVRENPDKQIQVYIRPKKQDHYQKIINHPSVIEIVSKLRIPIHEHTASPNIIEGIRLADFVIAIGFTTPGMNAISMGIPTTFYFPFKEQLNSFLTTDSSLIVHSADEVADFLGKLRNPLSNIDVNDLDPFRDGKARERLIEAINLELRT